MTEHAEPQRRPLLGADRREHEHEPVGVGVVGRRRDRHLAAVRQHRTVAHRDRRQDRLRTFDDFDAREAARRLGTGRHRERHVVRACSRGGEHERARREVRRHLDTFDRVDRRERHRGHRRRPDRREDVDLHRLADERLGEQRVELRCERARGTHVDEDLALDRVRRAVRDAHGDAVPTESVTRLETQQPVLARRHLSALDRARADEPEVVAVRVEERGKDVDLGGRAGLDLRDRHADLGRCAVVAVGRHTDPHGRGGRRAATAAVGHRVVERVRAARARLDDNLQRPAASDRLDVTNLLREGVDRRDGEDAALRVDIVVEHGEHRRAPRPHPEHVGLRHRLGLLVAARVDRVVLLLVLRVRVLLRLRLGAVLDVLPVRREHLRNVLREPHHAADDVVEDDDAAVDAEPELGRRRHALEALDLVFLARAPAQVARCRRRPRTVLAAARHDGRRSRARRARRDELDVAARRRDARKVRARRDEHRVVRRPRELENRVRAGARDVARPAVAEERRACEDDELVTDSRSLDRLRDAADHRVDAARRVRCGSERGRHGLTRFLHRAVLRERQRLVLEITPVHGARRGVEGHDVTRVGRDRDRPRSERERRRLRLERERAEVRGASRPHVPVGRRHRVRAARDRDTFRTADLDRARERDRRRVDERERARLDEHDVTPGLQHLEDVAALRHEPAVELLDLRAVPRELLLVAVRQPHATVVELDLLDGDARVDERERREDRGHEAHGRVRRPPAPRGETRGLVELPCASRRRHGKHPSSGFVDSWPLARTIETSMHTESVPSASGTSTYGTSTRSRRSESSRPQR